MKINELINIKSKMYKKYLLYGFISYCLLHLCCFIIFRVIKDIERTNVDYIISVFIINILGIIGLIFYITRKIQNKIVLNRLIKSEEIKIINLEIENAEVNKKDIEEGVIFTKNYIITFQFFIKILKNENIERIYITSYRNTRHTKCMVKDSKKIYSFYGTYMYDRIRKKIPDVKRGNDGTEIKRFIKLLLIIMLVTFIFLILVLYILKNLI